MIRIICILFLLVLVKAQNTTGNPLFCWNEWYTLVPVEGGNADKPPPWLMGQPKVSDCEQVFSNMQREARYNQSIIYTRSPTNGSSNSTTLLPFGWEHQTCLIAFDTNSGDAINSFTIASLMPSLSFTLWECVQEQPDGYKWGGTYQVGPSGLGFYVAVQYNDGFQDPGSGQLVLPGRQNT